MEIENNSLAFSFLSKLSLFSGLDEKEFNLVIAYLKNLKIEKGKSVFNEGDDGKEMFIFYSGALSAFGTQSDGTQRKLFDVSLGDFFGEMSIISHEPRSVTITAMEDSVLIMLSETDFYKIIREYPATGKKILKAIGVIQNRWLSQTSKSFSDLIRWGESARRRAITDELTGLYNRSFLEESIRERLNNQSMNLRMMSLLMMDLDKIHGINDRYGTKGGDLVIIAAAETISSCLRPGDIAARLSGDEFSVLLPDTDKKNAAVVAEKIRESIEKRLIEVPPSHASAWNPGASDNAFISTRTSIGIALAPVHATVMENLMETSDTALRKAKELGRNRVEVFS